MTNAACLPSLILRVRILLLLVPFSLVATRGIHAAVVALESFKYDTPGSDLLGKDGGVGFSGPWFATGFNASLHENYDISATGLTYPDLLTSGGSVLTRPLNAIGGIGRRVKLVSAGDTKTLFFTVLLRPFNVLHQGLFNGFFGLYLDGTGNSDLFMGKPGGGAIDRYVLENRGGTGQVASAAQVVLNQTALLILKADFTPKLDRFTLIVDPQLCPFTTENIIVKDDLDVGDVSTLVIYSTGAFVIDEIRVLTDLEGFACPRMPFPLVADGDGERPLGGFRRGDVAGTGAPDMSGAVQILEHLFASGATPLACEDAADANDSGRVDMADAVYLLSFLFSGGPAPPPPGPFECGADASADDLGCGAYASCSGD